MHTNPRLQHDAAFAMATALLDIVRDCIREDEHNDAFACFYETCKAGIEAFCIQQDRLFERLHPGKN
jgi:hypothetical protein